MQHTQLSNALTRYYIHLMCRNHIILYTRYVEDTLQAKQNYIRYSAPSHVISALQPLPKLLEFVFLAMIIYFNLKIVVDRYLPL